MPYQRKRYGIEPDPSIQHPAGILVDERRQTGGGKHQSHAAQNQPGQKDQRSQSDHEILEPRRRPVSAERHGHIVFLHGSDGKIGRSSCHKPVRKYFSRKYSNFPRACRISLSRKIPARKARSRPAELRASFGTVQSFRSGTGSERKPATDSWKRLIFPRRNATAQAENRSNYRSDSQSRRPTQSLPGISPRNARPNRLPVNVVRALRGSESEARAGRSG